MFEPTTAGCMPAGSERLVVDRALELEVRPPLMTVINAYEVEPITDGARIRHALEISGRVARPMRWVRMDRLYQRLLDKEVSAVIAMAGDHTRTGVGASSPDDAPAAS